MTIEEMKKKKQQLGYTNADIARLSGVPVATVEKIFAGITKSPRYDTLQALEKVLKAEYIEVRSSEMIDGVREKVFKYEAKRQGEYTIKDIEDLPEKYRVELIDGFIYVMESPTYDHQEFSAWLLFEMKLFVRKNGGECIPLAAPIDVQLDRNDKTLIVPDIIVVCDRDKITKKRIVGAPEMIVEILSPSTRNRDLTEKAEKYRKAGVEEYWIVDLEKERVIVYLFEDDDPVKIYSFDDIIPVDIWDGKCKIDFREYKKEKLAF